MPTKEEQELLAMAARHAQQPGRTVSGIDAVLGGIPTNPLEGIVEDFGLPEPEPRHQVRTASVPQPQGPQEIRDLETMWETPRQEGQTVLQNGTVLRSPAPGRQAIEELFAPDPALAGVYGGENGPADDISDLFMTGEAAQAAEAGVPSDGSFTEAVGNLGQAGDNFDISFGDDNDIDSELASGGGPVQRFASAASSPRFRVDRGLPSAPTFTGRVEHGGSGRVVSRREGGQFQTLPADQVRAEARARLESRHNQARVAETRAQAQRAQATRTVPQQGSLVQRPAPTPRTSGTIYDRISKGGLDLD